jgi:ADP-heptose:LPS heptosyltransferase
LNRGGFITVSHGTGEGRHWPNSNLIKLAQQVNFPVVVFGTRRNPEIPGAIRCLDKPFQVIAAIIRWSCFYLGPDSGVTWLATTTNTPMAVIVDPVRFDGTTSGFRAALRGEKNDIQEWDIYTSLQTVVGHIESKLPLVRA